MRDHTPITIEEFNGLWKRGGVDSTPLDHFSDCNNISFIESGFETRAGIDTIVVSEGASIQNVLKVKTYRKLDSESLLVLDTSGNIYDTGSPTPLTPILTIVGMVDFGFATFSGRAYISPTANGAHGMSGQFIYVYLGDGTPARIAAGNPPTDADGALAAANSGSAGNVEAGVHVFAVVYETNTGFLTQIGPDTLPTVTAPGSQSVNLTNIPVSPNSYVTKRHIVATRAIDPTLYTGNTKGYQFFFLPDGVISDNTTTTLTVSFFDSELLDDASHLLDLYSQIPAALGLTFYHGRMVAWTFQPDNEHSVVRLSYPGEPEAFDQVVGLIQLDANDNPITVCQQLRDILYIFKQTETYATQDNGDDPATWSVSTLDAGIGFSHNGIALSLDTGGVMIDYLLGASYSGIMMFSGTYAFPELSFKIADLWSNLTFDNFVNIEFYDDTVLKRLYIILPDLQTLLFGDYQHGLDPMKIRWSKFTFDVEITSITLRRVNELVIAAKQASV